MDTAVQNYLKSTESALAILEAETTSNNGKDGKRVLAIISHVESALDGRTEGSLFIFRVKTNEAQATAELALAIQRVFPIDDDFSIQMAQAAQHDHQEAQDLVAVPGSAFTLTITPCQEDHDNTEPIVLLSNDIQGIKKLLSEYKVLKETASNNPPVALQTFSWLSPYTRATGRAILSNPPLTPLDLRLLQRPLHTRLTTSSAGSPGDDVADIILVRDHWLREQARLRSRVGQRRLRLKLGTFNVNGVLPSQDLSPWLGHPNPNSSSKTTLLPPLSPVSPLTLSDKTKDPFDSSSGDDDSDATDPDMIVLGFQELDLSTGALLYSTDTTREGAWCTAAFAALGEKADMYEKLTSKQLVGILIVVIVKKSLRDCFSGVQTCYAGVGVLGLMGNKGGTAVRVRFTPTPGESEKYLPATFTFVNSHLAAFDEMYERRNTDFQELSRRLGFPAYDPALDGAAPLATSPTELSNVYESDLLLWMGDLNYRLDLPDADIRIILSSDSWQGKQHTLLQHDQLKNAQKSRKAFVDFKEQNISYPPTYRFSPGMATDNLGYDVKRKPAWTDRILYMHGPAVSLTQVSYTSRHEIRMSDHKPVSGDFLVDVHLYSHESFKSKAKWLSRQVGDMDEPGDRPSLKTGTSTVQLGMLRYERSSSAVFTVQNIGKVPCVFRLVALEKNAELHPNWMQIQPLSGLLLPNEVADITLSTTVDSSVAAALNLGPKQLNSTLILHTAHGKDHFVTVEATWQYTCLANKLSRLVRLPGPILSMEKPDDLLEEDKAISSPRELMRLVNWLSSSPADTDTIVSITVEESLLEEIVECLDADKPFSQEPEHAEPHVVDAFAQVLLRFLSSLPEPLVPRALHAQCGTVQTREEAFQLLDAFSPVSLNVWIAVTAFLHFICHQDKGKAERLASIFAPAFFRDTHSSPTVSPLVKRNFTLLFIN